MRGLLDRYIRGEELDSRTATLYNFPDCPQRDFREDYPDEITADADGILLRDVDGRPIVAPASRVVGRRVVGGDDQAIPPAEFVALATEGTGRVPQVLSQSELGRDVGRTRVDRYTRLPIDVTLSRNLTEQQIPNVLAQELGHVVDQLAGEIPVAGLSREVERVYNAGISGQWWSAI